MSNNNFEGVSGIFNSELALQQVLNELDRIGYGSNVSVLMSQQTRDIYGDAWSDYDTNRGAEGFEHSSKMPEGASTGGLTGGILGAIVGGLTLVGSVIVPGAGLLVAGPLIGAITGGAIGTAAGGLVGALVGAGIPEIEAKYYDDALKQQGSVLVVATIPKDADEEVRNIFRRCGAQSVKVV